MISIGIDPGLHGAIVAIDDSYRLLFYSDCPVIVNTKTKEGKKSTTYEFAPPTMADVLRTTTEGYPTCRIKAWLERAGAMPKQGLSSTFKTGRGFGLWEGMLVGIGIIYDIVGPRTWSKVMFKGTPLGDPKQRSLTKCQRLYPDLPLTLPRGRVLSLDGRSDAALIATYGMMQMRNDSNPDMRKPVKIKRKR